MGTREIGFDAEHYNALKRAVTSVPIGIFRNFSLLNKFFCNTGPNLFSKIVPKMHTDFRNDLSLPERNSASSRKLKRKSYAVV